MSSPILDVAIRRVPEDQEARRQGDRPALGRRSFTSRSTTSRTRSRSSCGTWPATCDRAGPTSSPSDGEKPDRIRDREFEDRHRVARRTAGRVGGRVAVPVRRPGAADRRRPAAHGDDPRRAALGVQGDQPAGGALRRPRYQILFLGKHLKGAAWTTLSVPRGQSEEFNRRMMAARPEGRRCLDPLGPARHGPHQPPPHSGDARGRAHPPSSRWPAATRRAPRPVPASGTIPHAVGGYQACSIATTSMRSTSRSPTACTSSGRWRPSTPASTCCARSRWRWTAAEVDRIAAAAARAGVVVEEGFMYRHEPLTTRWCRWSVMVRWARSGPSSRGSPTRRAGPTMCDWWPRSVAGPCSTSAATR